MKSTGHTLVLLNNEVQKEFASSSTLPKTQATIETNSTYQIIQVLTTEQNIDWHIKVEKNAYYEHWLINLSTQPINFDLNIQLKNEGACAHFYGILLGKNQAHLHHQVRMNHEANHTQTQMHIHGIADDKSKVHFDGIIYVKEKIKDINANEQIKNLLLSNQAEIKVKPILEIYSNEVACTHGTSIGDLDEDALFYLQSRGFSAPEAKQILLKSFATQFLAELKNPNLQTWIETLILEQLKLKDTE